MKDERIYLPVGSIVELDAGSVYRIIGEPIGCGGGSVLYPAQKQFLQNGVVQTDGILYALKECYPVSAGHLFSRNQNGEIIPSSENDEDVNYLHRAQLLQLEEGAVSRHIYQTASRMLPIRDSAQSILLTLPGREAKIVPNTVTVMDSLAEKGRSLTAWIKERRRFTPAETFRIIQQLLFALREVHQAGFLHLDIQDGNVFLRGTLEDKSELVTLIDFGSARAMVDGKTAPIRDRVIFTTQGFSAPEILLCNDGELQLGAEADIYSVGCLALYLLTGQRANVRELMENRTGNYLKSNQLRRIKCPAHLVETMQQILAKALAREPKNRYRSADEMLTDVTGLVDALQPYRTDLNSVKYDAFVCYKHGPVDSAAALTLQRALENYRAPKGACEKRRPFGRVFVDEGELSSCADFGQQIREALKNSGWLIVICSPDTPMSPWVQLEIDTFLEYHDRSRILAVLTGGNAEVSFPPQLKGSGGMGEVFAPHALSSTPQEAAKKLKGDTLLKIVAPMLGTTYDTLKQRHKIYQLQRIAAITAGFLAVVSCFAGYAVNRAKVIADQAVRIEEAYENALRNESLFLSEQAEKLLADNDPLGAMELALQALPSKEQNRPVLPEAEYALGKALGIYTTPSVAENTATPVGIIDTDCPYFFLSEDGKKLYAWDDSTAELGSIIECWSTENLSLLWEYSMDHGICTQPFLSTGGSLFVMGYHNVHCMDAVTGEEIWSIDIANTKAISLSRNASEVMVISEEKTADFETNQNEEKTLRLTATVLDPATGKELRRTAFQMDGSQRVEGSICISPDLKFAAIPTVDAGSDEFTWYSYNSLYLVDMETGNCDMLLDSQTAICDMQFVDDDLAVLRASGYTLTTQHNALYEYDAPYTYWMEAYNVLKKDRIWSREITDYFETNGICEILCTEYDDGNTTGFGLLYIFDDHCVLLDRKSGEIIRQYKLPAAATTVSLTAKGFETVNTDGSYVAAGFGIDTLMNVQYFGDTVSEACHKDSMFFVQNTTLLNRNHAIYKYQLNWYDDSFAMHYTADNNSWQVYSGHALESDKRVILIDRNRVCLVDIETAESWIHMIPEQYGFSEYRILGTSAKGDRLYWTESGHWDEPECWIKDSKYYVLDFTTGQIDQMVQPLQPHENITVWDTLFEDSTVLIAATWYDAKQDHLSIYAWDVADGVLKELCRYDLAPAPGEAEGETAYLWESYLQGSLMFNPESGQVSFAIYENHSEILTKLITQNVTSGDPTEISLRIEPAEGQYAYGSWQSDCCQWNGIGSQAVFVYGNHILAADSSGNIIASIPITEPIVSVRYTPDEQYILVVSQSGDLSKYRITDSVQCASVNLTEHCSSLYAVYADGWQWEFLDESTLLAITNYGGFLMDVSQETIKMKAFVDQCIGYDAVSDRFLVAETDSYSGKNTVLGSFRRYSAEDLIRKANAVLNQ